MNGFIPVLSEAQIDQIPLQERLRRDYLDEGKRAEDRRDLEPTDQSQTLTYKYTDFETQAPQHHKTVAELRFRDKTDQEIASITGFRVAQVRRILAHAPVAQWVARMRLRLEELSREFDGKKYELASDAFEVQAAVVRGTEKVSRERLAAVLDAQKKDPAGRFNHYEEKSNKTKIVGTNDLREHIENARRRLAVDATVVQQLEEQPDEAGQTAAGN